MSRSTTAAAVLTASLAVASAAPSVANAAETQWKLDPDHSQVGFRVRHMMVSWARGHFEKFQGTLVLDEAAPERARIDVTIDAASVNTNVAKRDEHLRSTDFFDVTRFPTLTFKSKRVEARGDGRLDVLGDLTIRGVTKPVTLEVSDFGAPRKDPWGGTRRGATATARINRKDFGLVWNGVVEGGGVLVGDEVLLQLEIELIKVEAPAKGGSKT